MRRVILSITTIFLLSNFCYAQEEVIFTGVPEVRISEGGVSRTAEELSGNEAAECKCIITRIGDSYYWTTRENVELIPVASGSGAFTTYLAVTGAGYVRVMNPEFRALTPGMSETEQSYDYIEHVLMGLRTISYYGHPE